MRGCRTVAAGTAVSPVCWNSLTSSGNSLLARCIAFAVSSSTRLTTNSFVRRMFFSECLIWPSLLGLMPITQSGGSSENTLKKENGAQFAAVSAVRGDPGDRPRDDEADEELVALERRQLRKLQVHEQGVRSTFQDTRPTFAFCP